MNTSLPLAFLDVGTPELMLIFFVILLLFGGQRLPELAKGLGKSIREFKKASAGVEEEIKRAIDFAPEPTSAAKPTLPAQPVLPTSPSPVSADGAVAHGQGATTGEFEKPASTAAIPDGMPIVPTEERSA